MACFFAHENSPCSPINNSNGQIDQKKSMAASHVENFLKISIFKNFEIFRNLISANWRRVFDENFLIFAEYFSTVDSRRVLSRKFFARKIFEPKFYFFWLKTRRAKPVNDIVDLQFATQTTTSPEDRNKERWWWKWMKDDIKGWEGKKREKWWWERGWEKRVKIGENFWGKKFNPKIFIFWRETEGPEKIGPNFESKNPIPDEFSSRKILDLLSLSLVQNWPNFPTLKIP